VFYLTTTSFLGDLKPFSSKQPEESFKNIHEVVLYPLLKNQHWPPVYLSNKID
jgi:hypothetical protein